MRQFPLLLTVFMLSLTIASANPIPCTPTGLGAGGAVNSSTVITCGVLTFDDFEIVNATGVGNPSVIDLLGTPTYDSLTGDAILNFNPNLSGIMDDEFAFAVWGGISQIEMSVGGSDGTIFEEACANPVPTSGILLGLCTNSAGSSSVPPLGSITVSSGTLDQPIFSAGFAETSPVYIFKNINEDGGLLSEFNQGFNPIAVPGPTTVPEPVVVVPFGAGLLALGLLHRRARKN